MLDCLLYCISIIKTYSTSSFQFDFHLYFLAVLDNNAFYKSCLVGLATLIFKQMNSSSTVAGYSTPKVVKQLGQCPVCTATSGGLSSGHVLVLVLKYTKPQFSILIVRQRFGRQAAELTWQTWDWQLVTFYYQSPVHFPKVRFL